MTRPTGPGAVSGRDGCGRLPSWTLQKDARRLTAYVRTHPHVEGLELRFVVDGRFLHSQLYRGSDLARLKPDADAKRAEVEAKGWSATHQRGTNEQHRKNNARQTVDAMRMVPCER
jgi:hypothetical protein